MFVLSNAANPIVAHSQTNPADRTSADGGLGSGNSLLIAPAYQEEGFACPLLPGCPLGPAIPLPPVPAIHESNEPSIQGEIVSNPSNLAEGSGKYKGLILIPAGPFEMGSPDGVGRADERPWHTVYLGDFYISKHEVTNAEFCKFLNKQGEISSDGLPSVRIDDISSPIVKVNGTFQPRPGYADKPVTHVSWFGAYDYAQSAGGRLPTSAQWEKAALYTTINAPKDDVILVAEEQSSPVYTSDSGAFHITGMSGNVWEWCSDWYSRDYYALSPSQNPLGPSLGQEKIIRSGAWASPVSSRRSQNVHKAAPRGYYRTVGFRMVKD
ncbi:MAG: SUMF1/EgtB/PvdO family nonheme iron enzyme [Pseudomonadota bacterium]